MSARRPYMRPMDGWWRLDPFFMRYMVREATALCVALYAVVLLAGTLCLAHGESAWNAWLELLRTPASILLHLLMLVAMIYHAYSWFEIMPKTLPVLFIGGRRVAGSTITRAGLIAAVLATLITLTVAWTLRP